MAGIGRLVDEDPEPMNRDHFIAIQKRLHAAFNGGVLIDRADALRMLDEIRWLKRRLRRLEHAVEPLIESVRGTTDA
jgi:hypothetical protein